MPIQPKKYKTKQPPPSQKNKRTLPKQQASLKKHLTVFFGVILMTFLVAFGYQLGQNEKTISVPQSQTLVDKVLVNKTKETNKETNSSKETHRETNSSEARPVKIEQKNKESNAVALAYRAKKPKLVIVIDDISSKKQLEQIRALPFKVTPSIFPPYALSKSNHLLASGLSHYMIHLPMQSGKAYDKQYGTLMISDSKEKIEARAKELRRLFPTARYINNHTGSVFTNNYPAMKLLYVALRNERFVFVDSRTTGVTKVPKIAHELGDAYVARDIFIDNKKTIPSIHEQLKKAVISAKKNGYAIAIGHPYAITMKALANAESILEEVELVYIDEIYAKGR